MIDLKEETTDALAESAADRTPAGAGTWILAVALLAVSTVLFNVKIVTGINQRRTVAPAVASRYAPLLVGNDTTHFLDHLARSVAALRQGEVYFPVGNFDCPVTYLAPCGAVVLLTGWPLLVVHNLFFLVVFFLNGLFAFTFLRSLARSTAPALIGALAYQGANFVLMSHYMGHMNNIQVQWIPLVFLAVSRLVRKQAGWGWAALLGCAMGLQVLSSPYYTLFLVCAALPVFTVSYWASALRRHELTGRDLARFALQLAVAVVLTGLLSSFYLVKRLAVPSETFTVPMRRVYSLNHYLELLDPNDPALFLGLPWLVLAILALQWWWRHPRPLTTAVALTMTACLLLMLIPLPGTPYWFYYHLCPMFKRLRVPLRFFPLFHLMLLGLVTLYLDEVARTLGKARRGLLYGGLLCALVGMNWLASPWVVNLNPRAAIKKWLGHQSASQLQAEERKRAATSGHSTPN